MITMVGTGGKVTELSGVSDMPASLSGTIIIESATRPELKRLADAYALNYGNLCDALDINEAPRLEHRDDYDYLYLRLPNISNSHDVIQPTRPLLAIYNRHVLLLIASSKFTPIFPSKSFASDLADMPSVSDRLVYFLAHVIDSFGYHIKIQTDAIHNVVVKMQARKLENEDFVSFVMIEEQINSFTSALTPLIPLFNRLQADRSLHLSAAANDMLIDIILATQQSISICDANAKRITSIRDAYTTLSNDSLNRIMKTLTIATVLIAAPNLIFSMYGMNIRLPLQHEDASFVAVLILAAIILALFIVWGKRRRLF